MKYIAINGTKDASDEREEKTAAHTIRASLSTQAPEALPFRPFAPPFVFLHFHGGLIS
jgi:hypothetical protein